MVENICGKVIVVVVLVLVVVVVVVVVAERFKENSTGRIRAENVDVHLYIFFHMLLHSADISQISYRRRRRIHFSHKNQT